MQTSLARFFLLFSLMLSALLVGCGGSPTKESTGQLFDDSLISSKVKAALINAPDVKARHISIETFKGVVQLSGFVDTEPEMDRAVAIANSVNGVKSVKNDMAIRREVQ
jgi:osmotically-inducible protein OsmY